MQLKYNSRDKITVIHKSSFLLMALVMALPSIGPSFFLCYQSIIYKMAALKVHGVGGDPSSNWRILLSILRNITSVDASFGYRNVYHMESQ